METLQIVLDSIASITPWTIILGIITALVTASLMFVFGWFALRFAYDRITMAMLTGKIGFSGNIAKRSKWKNVAASMEYDRSEYAATKRAYDREIKEWQEEFDRDSMHYFD